MASGAGFVADLAGLYPDLDAAFFERHDSGFEELTIAGGEALLREGEPSDALYLLLNGRLAATRRSGDGAPQRLGEIGRGELVGEMSVLAGGCRTATVTALRDSRLLRISNAAFLDFMQRHPSVTRQFVRILVERLTPGSARRNQKLATLALLPAGTGDHAAALARDLTAALRGRAAVLAVDAAFATTIEAVALAARLDDLEQAQDLLLYVGSGAADAWTRLCLRQADRVLLVADAADAAGINAAEALLATQGELRGAELVLLHPAGSSRPLDTARWLTGRRLLRHHHLRRGDPGDMARLGRHLLGRSVGLALGGGGARAFAEIGVLQALAEAGVPVDVIGGTSMGAVIGALVARGDEPQAIRTQMLELVRMRPFSGLTLPLVSLLSGRRLRGAMRALFGDLCIEDLRLRYCCVACNLSRGSVAALEAGALARWLVASNAIPGVMPPLLDGGELFVDGGLLDNVPAGLVAARNSGPVIAVNVSGTARLEAAAPDDADLSGWRMLIERLRGRRRVPGLGRILVRSMLLGSANQAAAMRDQAALYLAPELPGVDVGDWQACERVIDAGYRHASEALQRWHHVI